MFERSRFAAIKIRFALILAGVALGLLARWVTGGFSGPAQQPHFRPLPEELQKQLEDESLLSQRGPAFPQKPEF